MGLFDFGKKKREAAAAAAAEAEAAYEKGMRWFSEAWENGKKDSAFREAARYFRKAAEAGHARACYMLAKMADGGRGMEQDSVECARWCALAAQQGLADAQLFYGELLALGCGMEENLAESFKWYTLAGEQGNCEAWFQLGCLYAEGRGCPKSKKKAEELWIRAAETGSTNAQLKLGELFRRRGNTAEAEKWYRLAEEQGSSYAADELDDMGLISARAHALEEERRAEKEELAQIRAVTAQTAQAAYQTGLERLRKVEIDLADRWFEAAAKNGCGEAAYEISERWRKRRSDPQLSDRMVLQWLRRASELGHMEGCARLGWALATGANGARVDLAEARRLLEEAAAGGFQNAPMLLGYMDDPLSAAQKLYEQGKKIPSLGCLRISAETGDKKGMYLLGERYYEGEGTKQNTEEAKYWLRKASKKFSSDADFLLGVIAMREEDYPEAIRRFEWLAGVGDSAAQFNMTLAYEKNGEPEKGFPWLRLAAEQGDADAQYKLATNLLKGIGTEFNSEEAIRWLRRCVNENQYPKAMNRLACMYGAGDYGLPRDFDLSADLFEKAAEAGLPEAMYNIALRYRNGFGRERDGYRALQWAYKARDAGVYEAEALIKVICQ